MGTHKINADLDVNGEVQGTSLDINGADDISSNLTVGGNVTVPGDIIHDGDTSTKIRFGSGSIALASSGGNAVTISSTATELHRSFSTTGSTDGNGNGDVVFLGGVETEPGKIYHYKSDGTWELVDASNAATCDGLLAVALGSESNTNGMLIRGMVTLDHDPGAVGDVLFVSETSGQATATAPTTDSAIVRVIGYCLNATTGEIFFNPDGTFVEVTA